MMVLKVKEKEYKVKFGYNSFCDTDLMDRTSALLKIFQGEEIDEDKDGIIYLKDIVHGNYQVAMVELDGLEGYSFSTAKEKIKLKEKIVYENIVVTEEIKDQSEVDMA